MAAQSIVDGAASIAERGALAPLVGGALEALRRDHGCRTARSAARCDGHRGPSAASAAARASASWAASTSVAPLRLPTLGRSIACCSPSCQSSTRDQRLGDIGDDLGAAGRAEGQHELAVVVEDEGRRHRAARSLAAFDPVRHRPAVVLGHEGEIGELVVEQEAAAPSDREPKAFSMVVGHAPTRCRRGR